MKLPFKNLIQGIAERMTGHQPSPTDSRFTKNEIKAIGYLSGTNPFSIRNAPRRERRTFERAIQTLARNHSALLRNYYDSGNPWSDGSRSQIFDYAKDARYDQNPVTRRTMELRCRHWEQNSELMKRALAIKSQYIIGTHMPVVTSLASDPVWAEKAEKVFNELCESAGINGESMFALMDLAHRRKCVDGNCLAVETSKPGAVIYRRGHPKYETIINVDRPAYQIIESQRIGNHLGMWFENDANVVDGVQYKTIQTRMANGRVREQLVKAGYWVNDTTSSQNNEGFIFVPVENSFYWTTAHRVNEPRGISDFYATEPTLALLEDLLKLEMRAQEIQSDLTVFITNGAGQLPDAKMQATMGAMGIKLAKGEDGKAIVTAKDVENVKEIYQKIYGGRQIAGRTSDTLQFLAPNRPAEATLNLWNYLIDLFCAGSDMARVLLIAKTNKGQGTEVRAEIEAANAAWKKEFNLLPKPFLQRAWRYFMGWATKNDERVTNPPADWDQIEVSPPRSVCVDIGYDSVNKLAEMAAGVYTLHAWAQDHGTTKNKIIQQSVSDLFDIKLACAKRAESPEYQKYGITVDAAEVRQNLAEVVKSFAAKATAEAALETARLQTENQPA